MLPVKFFVYDWDRQPDRGAKVFDIEDEARQYAIKCRRADIYYSGLHLNFLAGYDNGVDVTTKYLLGQC